MPKYQSLGISTSVAVLAAATARNGIPTWDTKLFVRINDLPDGLAVLAWAPMQAGALGAPLAVAAVLAVRKQRALAIRVASDGVAAWLAAKATKKFVNRARPGQTIESTNLRIGSADTGLGFPSGHAAVATTLARDLSAHGSPLAKVGAFGLVLLVGASRIYVGAHYPLDVIGGWALGWSVGDLHSAALELKHVCKTSPTFH